MQTQTLKAEQRKILGRKVKTLRREGFLPANIYGKKVKSEAVQVKLDDFDKIFRKVGETGLVDLTVGKKKRPVLIHNVQVDPVTDAVIHADFLHVNLKEKVSAQVPIELSGEAPAEKEGKGTVVQYIDEIGVEALPRDLPEKFEVDLSGFAKIDAQVQVKDLVVDKGKVEIQNEPGQIVVKVEPPRKEEEEVVPPTEEEKQVEETPVEAEEKGKETEAKGGPKEEKVKESEQIKEDEKKTSEVKKA